MNDVLRGVLFSLGGNIAISVGDHLKVFGEHQKQKNGGKKLYHGKTLNQNRAQRHRRLFLGILGYLVMLTGQICNGYALAFAPQTLLACIGSVQFIMNLVCSAVLMGRPVRRMHIVGTLSIIIGCLVMIFGFSPRTDQSALTVYALFYNFNSPHYRNYLVVVVGVFLLSTLWQYIESTYLGLSTDKHSHEHSHAHSPQSLKRKKSTSKTAKGRKWCQRMSFSCAWLEPRLVSGFFYSFASAMTGTQSVVLGKTLAIIARNYAAGKIEMFDPLDLFVVFFVLIVFVSFLITFAFWLYRRTESMVLFDTIFIAPLNQVMWLTFSTVAGGIYFHEFENAEFHQWMGLICGMMLNYLGLYYLVPTVADQPMLVINMEKKQKMQLQKVAGLKKVSSAGSTRRKQVQVSVDRDSDVSDVSELEPLMRNSSRTDKDEEELEMDVHVHAMPIGVHVHSKMEDAIQPSLSDEEAPLISRSPSPKNLNSAMAKLALPSTNKWYQELTHKLSLFAVKNDRTE